MEKVNFSKGYFLSKRVLFYAFLLAFFSCSGLKESTDYDGLNDCSFSFIFNILDSTRFDRTDFLASECVDFNSKGEKNGLSRILFSNKELLEGYYNNGQRVGMWYLYSSPQKTRTLQSYYYVNGDMKKSARFRRNKPVAYYLFTSEY